MPKWIYFGRSYADFRAKFHGTTREIMTVSCTLQLITNHNDFTLKMVDEGFDVKEKVQKLLTENGYDKKRARTMDMDDFLG